MEQNGSSVSFGAMAHVMQDHLYILERGHLFTTPCVDATVSMRFYAMVVINATGREVTIEAPGLSCDVSAAAMKPPLSRSIRARAAQLIVILINPLHPHFPRFRAIAAPGLMPLAQRSYAHCDDAMQAAYRGELEIHEAAALFEDIIETTARFLPPVPTPSPRVLAALTRWREEPDLSLEQLARAAGVSSGRMSHVFTQTVGLPMKSYLLWRKVHRIASLFSAGLSLTEIAHACGFADASHMCTTFQEVFGAPPSHFLRSDLVRVRVWNAAAKSARTDRPSCSPRPVLETADAQGG